MLKAEFQEVLRAHPCVDRLLPVDTRVPLRQTIRVLRETHYDLVLDLHSSRRSSQLDSPSEPTILPAPLRLRMPILHRISARTVVMIVMVSWQGGPPTD
jgi:ADP-heptose:LPS heptosyltransferase